jgi:hypothetical protein
MLGMQTVLTCPAVPRLPGEPSGGRSSQSDLQHGATDLDRPEDNAKHARALHQAAAISAASRVRCAGSSAVPRLPAALSGRLGVQARQVQLRYIEGTSCDDRVVSLGTSTSRSWRQVT